MDGRTRLAEALVVQAHADPAGALEAAAEMLAADDSDEGAVVAFRAIALARRLEGDLAGSLAALTEGVRRADRLGLSHRSAEARMSRVVILTVAGRIASALREADRAATRLTGVYAARLLAQRGLVFQRAGRGDEAFDCYARALPVLRRHGDLEWEARLRLNRGALLVYYGRIAAAEDDLRRCLTVSEAAELPVMIAFATHNLGFAALRAGDVPSALGYFDDAEQQVADTALQWDAPALDRAEALLLAGLADEARRVAADAAAALERDGLAADAAEAQLMLARAALRAREPETARTAAEAACTAFTRQRRKGWSVLARHVVLLARWESGERGPAMTQAAKRAATALDRAGWRTASVQALFVGARASLDSGREAAARTMLAEVAAYRGAREVAELRTTGWHALALLRLLDGERGGAAAAARAGLRVLEENAATLGATDLRAGASAEGAELAELGLSLALSEHQPRRVLEWAELWRAGVLRRTPARPPQDAQLAADLASLRATVARIAEAGLAGQDTATLLAERHRLERSVRDRSRHARGTQEDTRRRYLVELSERLGGRALVEYVRHQDQLHAVTLVDGRARLHALGSYDDARRELHALRFTVNQLAGGSGSPGVRAAAELTRSFSAHVLDDLLLDPVRRVVGDRELVVVPTGDLHGLPWGVLPFLAGRPVSVAPSARLWLSAQAAPPGRGPARTVLAAGPRLEHAEDEIRSLAAHYPGATVLTGAAATADAIRTAIDGAALAHVAAHGHFRADNPQFSCLDAADGPLTVYDLERLRRAPRRLVLSACNSAMAEVRPGDELMGLATAVLALGTQALVASVVLVPDAETHQLMKVLHDCLVAGEGPAAALAHASASTGVDGFVCFGAG